MHVATVFADSPTLAISKAVQAHLPGSVVISEHTDLTDHGRVLYSRVIRAFSGNVVLDIVIARPTAPPPSHAVRIMQGEYAVTIRSKGYLPADPRTAAPAGRRPTAYGDRVTRGR